MIHWSRVESCQGDSAEYAAGFRARLSEIPVSELANASWRLGWESADTEALESARHSEAIAEGREDHFDWSWGCLFDGGRDARAHGIGFDLRRTEPWKRGWIASDIALGFVFERECA